MHGEEGELRGAKRARNDGNEGGMDLKAPPDAATTQDMTASQIATMVSEMLAGVFQGAPGMDKMLKMCFAEKVTVSTLAQRQHIVTGRDAVIEALVTRALVAMSRGLSHAEPIARVVADSNSQDGKTGLVSMALDVYAGGKSPFSTLATSGGGGSLVVFRARKSQIDQLWVGDCGAGAKMMCGSKESFTNSSTWPSFVTLIRTSLHPELNPPADTLQPSVVTLILNNYSKTIDKTGMGLGSETLSETWTEELLATSEEAMKEAEARRKQEQLDKSLAALDKVTAPLKNDKKIAKAAPIFLNMLKSETRVETADAVLKAARAALGGGYLRAGIEPMAVREVLKDAMLVMLEKKSVLVEGCSENPRHLESLFEAWRIEHVVANELRTDDTFQFAKAGKDLLQVLEKLPVPGGEGGGAIEGVDAESGKALAEGMLACLTVMQAKYTFAWSRAPLDMCIKILVNPHKRKHFGKHEEKLNTIMANIHKKKHGQGSWGSASHSSWVL